MYHSKYLKYKKKYLDLKNKMDQSGGANIENKSNKATMYLFKADWCPHCKKFLPLWKELSKKYNNIDYKTMDSEKNKKQIQQWEISGYPTIILKVDNKAIEYNGPRTLENISEFIENITK
tara:strand:- start:383 stop:742 length:360 start_codon:yes stop_codon:yes gene_type:complete